MSQEMLRRLSRRELAPREIAEVLRHVGQCQECARSLTADMAADLEAQLGALQTAIDDDEGPWHPDHAAIAAYVDGTAGPAEREIVTSHVEDCALCREDLADLAKLRRPRPRRSNWLAAFAAAATIAVTVCVVVQRDGVRREPAHRPPRLPVATRRPPTQPLVFSTATPEPPPRYANAEWDRLVRTAIETERLPIARGIDASPDVLRGPGTNDMPDLTPSGIVIDEARPRFSWPARDGATYVVSIFRDDQRVAQSEPLTETHWTPPTPLARGRTYVWQVQVTRENFREIIPAPPAPPATFRIISQRDHDELAEARRLHPDDHLLHAVLAARAGLREEALRALSRADTKIRPVDQSPLPATAGRGSG